MSKDQSASHRANTLGLQGQTLGKMLDELDAVSEGQVNNDRRHTRLRFRKDTVHMKVRQAGGPDRIIKVACRNLSSGGVCILHNAFLHPGSPCAVVLKDLNVGQMVVHGDIVRCQHRRGVIHEIGIKFRKPIDMRSFIEMDQLKETYNFEKFDESEIEGCLVQLDNSALDTKLVQHFLKSTRVRLRQAETMDEAIEMIGEGCDLIMLDPHACGDEGEKMIRLIRDRGNLTPVVVVSGDSSAAARKRWLDSGANGYLTKPFEQHRFLQAMAEFLINGREELNSASNAKLMEDSGSQMFNEEFTTELRSVTNELTEGLSERDPKRCQGACFRIVGAAPYSGHASLARAAEDAAKAITAGGIEEAVEGIQTVLDACQAILQG